MTATAVGAAYLVALAVVAWLSQAGGCAPEEVDTGCQAWIWANPFWGSYYSNLMSTAAGVALGLPVALWLNARGDADRRQAERAVDARQREREREADTRRRRASLAAQFSKRAAMLSLIGNEVKRNRVLLEGYAKRLQEGRLSTLVLIFDAWKALSSDLLTEISGDESAGELANDLTGHYATLQLTTSFAQELQDLEHRFGMGPIRPWNSKAEISKQAASLQTAIQQAATLATDLVTYDLRCRQQARAYLDE